VHDDENGASEKISTMRHGDGARYDERAS